MAGKIIEIIVLLVGLLITAAIVVKIPLDSYNEYKDYLAQIEEANKPEIKAELESITVQLKEGVRYFANDTAEVRADHFTVTANYIKGEESYSEPVEEGKFTVTSPTDFYANGGDVVVKYKNQSVTLSIELEPVVVETLELLDTPYTVKYAEGSTFDATGMVIQAVYNDGSSKIISADEYVVDTQTALTTSDNKVTVSYQIGDIIKTVDVEIGVSKTLDNGAVKSIAISNALVNAGDTLDNATITVIATYDSGNRKALSNEEYTISGSDEAVKFGKAYELTVTYNEDSTKTAKSKVIVRQTLQGEDGVIVGGKKNTEDEYVIIDGVITKLENTVSFAGNFSKVVTNGTEGSLTLVINSETATIGDITMRCGNSYLLGSTGNYWMQPLQINTILDLTINGREVQIPASVILKGCGPHADYAPLYGIYYEFTFEDVQLDPGQNVVKFNFKKSTVGALNCWGETPSTMNIDYVNFDTIGNDVPDNYDIEKIHVSNALNITYKQPFEDLTVPATATITGGTVIGLDPSLYNVTIKGADEGDTYFRFRTYTIEVSLKSDPSVKDSIEYTVPEFKSFTVLNAGVEIVDGKVYYVFSGNSTCYDAEDLVFFDGAETYKLITSFTEDTFVFKIDATDLPAGLTIYPHLSIEGRNYNNGANANGDIRGNGLTFTNGQSVKHGGKVYTIKTQYSMPTLVIAEVASYEAVKDNTFESDKNLLLSLVATSEGVSLQGNSKASTEYSGGIGGMDKANAGVTYTFTLDAAGKVDFIWNIAGSQYKSGVPNLGLDDMSTNMVVTIDGKAVDVSGISLPAGEGTTTAEIWWNLQQIVIKDLELSAGTHTFQCVVLADGSGANVGPMEIYYEAN